MIRKRYLAIKCTRIRERRMLSRGKMSLSIPLVLLVLSTSTPNMQSICVCDYPPPLPTSYFRPSEIVVAENQTFHIEVIVNVSAYWKMIAFQTDLILCLSGLYCSPAFDDTLLTLISIEEGPFLKRFPSPPMTSGDCTFFTGFVSDGVEAWVIGTMLIPGDSGWTVFPDGTGTLATITMKAIAVGSTKFTLGSTCMGMTEDGQAYTISESVMNTEITVQLFLTEDINDDGRVDMKDVGAIANAFGAYPGHPRWNSKLDVDQDGQINLKDVARVARKFGSI